MPINPELKHLYPKNWREISRRIRFERADGKCERCAVAHGCYRSSDGAIFDPEDVEGYPGMEYALTKIVLTTAHLNHDPTDNRDENLAALCQRCHLAHDQRHHLQSRRINQERRTRQRRLFER